MPKILVVDDDTDVVEAVSMFLRKEGFDVSSAGNREEGMTAVKSVKPDLLVLDVMMEEADDGFAMAQDLRRSGFSNPILMLTSINKVAGMQFGPDDKAVPVDAFLEKPVAPDKLIANVKELLSRSVEG